MNYIEVNFSITTLDSAEINAEIVRDILIKEEHLVLYPIQMQEKQL